MNQLGIFILSELDKKRMSQRDAIGVSEAHTYRVIKGKRGPSIRLYNEIAAALEVPPELVLEKASFYPKKFVQSGLVN